MNIKGKGEIRLQGPTGSRAVGNLGCAVTALFLFFRRLASACACSCNS